MDSERKDEQGSDGGMSISKEGSSPLALFHPKPTIRILIYVDDPLMNLNRWYERRDHRVEPTYVTHNEFGLYILHDLLLNEGGKRANIQIELIDRHRGGQASNKLTADLLGGFDEVWFIGYRQINTPNEPENELTSPEVAALMEWMNTGGVLMTGDHANPQPKINGSYVDPALDHLLGLGRAIGHLVPRAGALRGWEGSPAIDELVLDGEQTFIYNTQVPDGVTDPLDLALQEDEWPQKLILTTYTLPSSGPFQSSPTFARQVHPLFCGRTAPITVFPDHMHEGALTIPETMPAGLWPSGPSGQQMPEVVARGTDIRGEIRDLVMVYDGAPAGVGRIVADSTWHHYLNVNLVGFPAGGTVLSQLAQYYANLAVWLAPLSKRQEMSRWQLWQVLHNGSVVMASGNPIATIGRVASGVLRRDQGPCVITSIVDTLQLPSINPSRELRPPSDLLIGGIVAALLEVLEHDGADGLEAQDAFDVVVRRGLQAAYDEFADSLQSAATEAAHARDSLEERRQSE